MLLSVCLFPDWADKALVLDVWVQITSGFSQLRCLLQYAYKHSLVTDVFTQRSQEGPALASKANPQQIPTVVLLQKETAEMSSFEDILRNEEL